MSGRLRNPEFVGWLLLVAAVGIAAALVFWLQRGLTFGWDELVWLEIGGLAPFEAEQFLHPYGGHLIVFPYLLWRGILELFGTSFTAFSIVQVAGLSLSATLVYVYGKRRLGPLLALGPAVVLLFLGGSYPVLLQPMIGIQFLVALVPGLAAILLLEREDLVGDVAACALLCLALAGFSEALPFVVGAVVAVALSPNWKRRIWVLAVPILAYAYWRHWASQFEPTGIIESNILFLPPYFADALAVFGTAIFGLTGEVGAGPWSKMRLSGYDPGLLYRGIALIVAELIAIGLAVWSLRRRLGSIPRTFWVALPMLIALCGELGVILAPGRTAAEPRYLYAGVLLLLLVVIELLRGVKTTRLTVTVALVLTAAAVGGNLARFQDARQYLDAFSKFARADMTAIRLAGENGDQAFTPNVDLPGVISGGLVLNAGPWLLVEDRYGRVAYSVPELRRQDEDVREQADRVAVRSLQLRLEPSRATPRSCEKGGSGTAPTDVVLPRGGALLKPSRGSEVSLRRWADEFSADLDAVAAGQAVALRIPPDHSRVPWRLRFRAGGAVAVCPLDPQVRPSASPR